MSYGVVKYMVVDCRVCDHHVVVKDADVDSYYPNKWDDHYVPCVDATCPNCKTDLRLDFALIDVHPALGKIEDK
jgi:hypothetical protein